MFNCLNLKIYKNNFIIKSYQIELICVTRIKIYQFYLINN